MTYNIPKHRRGDTWDGINTIGISVNGTPVNLSGAIVTMEFREDYDSPVALSLSTLTSTISVLPNLSSIKVLPVLIDIPPATYKWDLQVTYPNTLVKTYLEGTWEIYFDITA
jgi:hypothetical protein